MTLARIVRSQQNQRVAHAGNSRAALTPEMEAGSGGSARGKARPRDSRFLRCQGRACRSRSRSAGYWLTVAAVSVVLLVGHAGMASGRRMWSQITTPGEEMEKRRPGRQASLRTSAAERPSPTVLRGGRNAAHSSTYEYVDNFGCRGGSSSEEDEITDVKGCEQMCSEQPSCFAFTFNVETSRCYIKTNCTVKRKYTNFSGLKLLPTPAPTTGAPTEAPTPAPTRPPVDYAPAPAPTPRSPRDYNVLYGVRCDETVIDSAESRSADECKERCEALDQCNAYSFEVGSGRCYVMGHCDSWEYYPGSISGVVAYYGEHACKAA